MFVFGNGFVGKCAKELQDFLCEALKHGYGSDYANARVEYDTGDKSYCIEFDSPAYPDWRYVDTWYGVDPFSGISKIYYYGAVCWTMIYWGKFLPKKESFVHDCLCEALQNFNPDHPWRGPNQYNSIGGLRYTNMWHGNIEKFYGQEKIGNSNDDWLYEMDYRGGIINLRV